MNPSVDTYLLEGCGRCPHYRTPQCKVHSWPEELRHLRRLVLACGLQEEYKWSQPCYTLKGQNVLIVTAFKEYAALAFFKGSLLEDTHGMLVTPGKHSQAGRQIRFTDYREIIGQEDLLKAYVMQAIEIEKAGKKVVFKKTLEPLPDELVQIFAGDLEFQEAFFQLTPGRQRGYILHFSQAKQSKTRLARIEKYRSKILWGKGLQER